MRLPKIVFYLHHCDFNPHIPDGMRHIIGSLAVCGIVISIHTSQTGCDKSPCCTPVQSGISIHTSQTGCDADAATMQLLMEDFNPHIPDGMRRQGLIALPVTNRFQSTHPRRDATCATSIRSLTAEISIHTSQTGCDFFRYTREK